MKTIILAAAVFMTAPIWAALSPINQSITEIQRISESDQLIQSFPSGEHICFIQSTEKGYLIGTQNYQMFVEVNYKQQDYPGPAKFDLIFNQPTEY